MKSYAKLIAEMKEIALIGSIGAVLGYDERTALPPKGTEHRSNQSAFIAKMVHEKFTTKAVGELLKEAAEETKALPADSTEATNVRQLKKRYDRSTKLPTALVEALSKAIVIGEAAWAGARKSDDFEAFAPYLNTMLDLKKQEIECYGYTTEPYDALLEDYEPGMTAAELRNVFEGLRGPLVELIGRITSSGKVAPLEILERNYPAELQTNFCKIAAAAVGFDFEAGRLDISVHPFCSGVGPGDTRMTTRYDVNYFGDAFFGTLHESGHALYDQGLPDEHFGTPCGEAVSLGIHESQSRMWENLVGRSESFWKFMLPKAREVFGSTLTGVSDAQWLWAVNDVRPSHIRVEADEATYNLHVLLRFEMETAILSGQMAIKDLPGEWNSRMAKYLGLKVPDNARGCLQDVHWSAGLMGYFPTYTLGNLYAAQFFVQARKDLGDLDAMFARGEFAPLLGWLRKNIHGHGQRFTAKELVQRITGKPLSHDALMTHLSAKAKQFYGV